MPRRQEDGLIPAVFMQIIREKRSVVLDAFKAGNAREAVEAYEELVSAVGKTGLMPHLVKVTFYRLLASTEPAAILQAAQQTAKGPNNAVTQKLWRFILGILEESGYLKGSPLSWRAEAVNAHITVVIRFNKINTNPAWDAEQLSFDLITLTSFMFRNLPICDYVCSMRASSRAQDSADLRGFCDICDSDPGRFAGLALQSVDLRVLLGCYINEPRFWKNRKVAIIRDTKERLTAMELMEGRDGMPE